MITLFLMIPLIGFFFAFHAFFRQENDFSEADRAFIRTLTILFGEFNLSDIFWQEKDKPSQLAFYTASWILVLLFILIMCIPVINTFTGLAVEKIGAYQKHAMLRAHLNSLQQFETPSFMSKLVRKYFQDTNWKKLRNHLDPASLFGNRASLVIERDVKTFKQDMHQLFQSYELDKLDRRQKLNALIKQMND